MGRGTSRFPTTSWSLVLSAARSATRQPALETLCAAYWPPVYAFARRQGNDPENAKDLTQAFFARFLEKHDIRAARPDRGRFRSFLLACVKHFLTNEWDRVQAQKRGSGLSILPFQWVDAEKAFRTVDPVDHMTPERVFERRWAQTMLQRALRHLRDDYERAGKGAMFERLKPVLTAENDLSYPELAEKMGMTAGSLKVAVHRMRRRYQETLRDEIAQTLRDPADTDDEIRYLFAALQRT